MQLIFSKEDIFILFLYLCLIKQNTLVMETVNLSEDYRPLILVAEDDDSNFKLIKAIIGKKCEILWAKNGEEMVGLFKENRGKQQLSLWISRCLS